MTKKILSLLFILSALCAGAQSVNTTPEMAEPLRANGKIYVVITVIALIFAAIIAFLIYIERRLNKIENKLRDRS